jgi:uncharacterized protein (TIGR02265 family)
MPNKTPATGRARERADARSRALEGPPTGDLSSPRGIVGVFEQAAQHIDVVDRLTRIRRDQLARGVWFRMLREEVARRGHVRAYDAEGGPHEATTFKMYPLDDYLRRLVIAGALIASPEKVHDGMRDLHRESVRYFTKSILGRLIISVMRPTPHDLLQQIERSRPHVANYGTFRYERRGPRAAAMHLSDEPVYIESAQLGSMLSTLDACGITDARTEITLHSFSSGTILAEW